MAGLAGSESLLKEAGLTTQFPSPGLNAWAREKTFDALSSLLALDEDR